MVSRADHLIKQLPPRRLDLPFLKHRSSSPYLIGPGGFFLRDPHSRKPLIFDLRSARAVPFDAADTDPALEGCFLVDGIEVGADHETTRHEASASRRPSRISSIT